MLKTISAALLAASVIAAPALAAEAGKTTTTAPVIKADTKVDTKSKAMNANAAVTPDEHKTVRTHRSHHKHLSAKKSLKAQPDVIKPMTSDKRS